MTEWKAAPRAAKEAEQRSGNGSGPRRTPSSPAAARSSRPATRSTRATSTRKQAMLAEVEALDVDADPRGRAGQAARRSRPPWHDAGRVPREAAAGLDRRWRAVEDTDPDGDGLGVAQDRAAGQPAAAADARAGRRGRAAAGPGPGGRRRPAHQGGRAGAGRPSGSSCRWPSRPDKQDQPIGVRDPGSRGAQGRPPSWFRPHPAAGPAAGSGVAAIHAGDQRPAGKPPVGGAVSGAAAAPHASAVRQRRQPEQDAGAYAGSGRPRRRRRPGCGGGQRRAVGVQVVRRRVGDHGLDDVARAAAPASPVAKCTSRPSRARPRHPAGRARPCGPRRPRPGPRPSRRPASCSPPR